jgi:hypothetical protein
MAGVPLPLSPAVNDRRFCADVVSMVLDKLQAVTHFLSLFIFYEQIRQQLNQTEKGGRS